MTLFAMFYSYDPSGYGIQFHDTAAEAQAAAEKALADATHSAADSDWVWADNEHEISWGEVRAKVEMNDREPTANEREEFPECDTIRDPKLVPVANAKAQQPAPNQARDEK